MPKLLWQTFNGMIQMHEMIKMPIDRIRPIIRIRALITNTQTNTLNW